MCPNVPDRPPIPGDENFDAEIMVIAESPGKDENKRGKVLVGRTGVELNELYLPQKAGIRRSDTFCTNAVKCYPRFDRDLHPDIVDSCSSFHLRKEIAACKNVKVIVLMGAVACSLVGLDVEMHHNRPRMAEILGFNRFVWPMYHPALGMHDYSMMQVIMDDWEDFGRWLRTGHFEYPIDEFPEVHYERVRTAAEVLDSFNKYPLWYRGALAIDTEFVPLPVGVDPHCATYSYYPGTGFLVYARDTEAVRAFAERVAGRWRGTPVEFKETPSLKQGLGTGWPGPILMHNALADLPVLDAMGVVLDRKKVRDTMILAYNLATLPQGLKPLAYRLCGLEMTEFDELVTPFAIQYWLSYVEMISQDQWPKLEPYMRMVTEKETEYVDGIPVETGTHMVEKLYKPQSLTTKLKRLMTDYRKSPKPKVFNRWWDWDDKEKEPVIAKYGDMPKKSIKMVDDEEKLLNYSVSDADGTLRIYPELVKLRKEFRRRYGV
jgi:DNA polymerase